MISTSLIPHTVCSATFNIKWRDHPHNIPIQGRFRYMERRNPILEGYLSNVQHSIGFLVQACLPSGQVVTHCLLRPLHTAIHVMKCGSVGRFLRALSCLQCTTSSQKYLSHPMYDAFTPGGWWSASVRGSKTLTSGCTTRPHPRKRLEGAPLS